MFKGQDDGMEIFTSMAIKEVYNEDGDLMVKFRNRSRLLYVVLIMCMVKTFLRSKRNRDKKSRRSNNFWRATEKRKCCRRQSDEP